MYTFVLIFFFYPKIGFRQTYSSLLTARQMPKCFENCTDVKKGLDISENAEPQRIFFTESQLQQHKNTIENNRKPISVHKILLGR